MFLSRWLRQLAQQWLLCGGKRRDSVRVCLRLEVLEDRLTPSGDVLAITTPAQNLSVGQVSNPITVQLQDGSGKPVTATSNVTVNLTSTSRGGQFLDGFAPLTNSSVIIPKGYSSASFLYGDTQIGVPTLTAKAPALHLATSQQEAVDVSVNFLSTPPPLTPGQPSQPITVGLSDWRDGQFFPDSPVTIQLSSSSSTGKFLDASGKVLANGLLTIPAHSGTADFEYQDSKVGFPTLLTSLDGAGTDEGVDVGVSLAFTTPAQNVKAGQPSGNITVQLQDSSGKAVTASDPITFSLISNSRTGQFLTPSGLPLSSSPDVTIPQGSSSYSFRYEDTVGGKPTLTAIVPSQYENALSATQQETVAGPYTVVFSSSPQGTLPQNQPSQPFTVQLQDSTGNLATALSPVTIPLKSSSSTGQFLDASGKVLAKGQLIVPAGSSFASFEYRDSTAGFPTLGLPGGWIENERPVNVGVSLVFTTSAQSFKAGQLSQLITVRLQDSHGKAFTPAATLNLSLLSDSSTGKFFDSEGNLLGSYFGLLAGSNSFSFTYEDSLGGKPTLTAMMNVDDMGLSATQQETIAGPYAVQFQMPQPVFIPQNTPSHPITVLLTDSTGTVVKATSAVTIQLSTSSKTGQLLDTSGKALPNGRLIIPAGANSASFAYKDSTAGFPTLTMSANGATSQQQVNVGVALVFSTPIQKLKAGQRSGAITLQLQDSNGKAMVAPSK